ncbi:unnamed protein product [Spirodela intermedia]|uniref:Uncharacterized protein n=1 Tax=Spirodela intermedia TaxID=51605 RepID=A0A7I8JK50_SPIIN|nr:unnamed protein product [Spirodela intermedia]CAA6670524.1 unnamed protein product [Spirodela intermedia]
MVWDSKREALVPRSGAGVLCGGFDGFLHLYRPRGDLRGGSRRIPLPKLWWNLQSSVESFGLLMDDAVKEVIWRRLLALPDLLFKSSSAMFTSRDSAIKSPDQSEKLGLRVVADEHLRDSFLGIYDLKAANVEITPVLKQVLERLAVARSNGIAQSQLSKEFKMKENKLFYYLKRLESQGLIVRQSTLLRTKEASAKRDDEMKDTAIVNTNLIYLYRYAKRLSSLQRVEITAPHVPHISGDPCKGNLEGTDGEPLKEDVNVKDYLPEMSAICNMLEESAGKVLVVSDIKLARGYRMTTGHRTWRNICNRMKDASLVEEFQGKVNGKVVKCLRLLKKFNPKDFQPKGITCGYESFRSEHLQRCSRRGQITDQFVELPIEHRIYDMIDGEGPKGLTISEVSKRLGLSSKRTEMRICDMCWRMPKRFPMHMRFENYNRTKVYRVWTLRNFEGNSLGGTSSNCENDLMITNISSHCEMDRVPDDQSSGKNMLSDFSSKDLLSENMPRGQVEYALINVSPICAVKDKGVITVEADALSQVVAVKGVDYDTRDVEAGKAMPMIDSPSECSLLVRPTSKVPSFKKYPSANEKFLLTAELHKWLDGLEKDKQTTMARKTLTRSLQRLQQEGYCKCIQISVPVLTNCNRSRAAEVILHPSIETFSSELLGQIHQRLRDFDMQSHGQGLDRPKNESRHMNRGATELQSIKVENMRINGYVPAIMVRAKLLHSFLWSFLRGLPEWDDTLMTVGDAYDCTSPRSMLKSFSLVSAMENMPFELFLQVVGSEKRIDNMVEKCRLGLRLSDLPVHEYKGLMDTHATGRLSRVIDILYRLKLIQLATEGMVASTNMVPHCLSTYSLELKPFIEVPRSSSSTDVLSPACPPRLRHDFLLTNREAVDSYWQTLEYCHVSADRNSSLKAFPGSAVKEIFLARSWTSVRVMTAEQNTELLERLGTYAPEKKFLLESVLRVSYGMRQTRRRRFPKSSEAIQQELNQEIMNLGSVVRKRKRPAKVTSLDLLHANGKTEETGLLRASRITDDDEEDMDEMCYDLTSAKHDIDVHFCEQDDNRKGSVDARATIGGKDLDSLRQHSLSRKKFKRQRKFSWSHHLDRKLIIEYVKYRAPLGAKFCRVDWTSITDLPADPDACKRRMYVLNSNKTVRKKVMKLCNIVGSRYTKFLRKSKEEKVRCRDGSEMLNHGNSRKESWDDFDDPEVKMAVDEVLRFKSMANLEYNKKVKSKYRTNAIGTPTPNSDVPVHAPSEKNDLILLSAAGSMTSCDNEFPSHSNGGSVLICRHVCESLSVANAVELFKLVFLSTSTAPEVRSLLAETLKWYSERDLTMAFNYLKEMKLMEHGHGNHQLFLSQRFLINAYSSPFPLDSGKRAAKFSAWLINEDKNLIGDGVNLNLDMQCGEVFQLLALFSSGSLSIEPCMPDEGVGEADDPKYSIAETSDAKVNSDEKTMKQKVWWRKESEPCNRREKGFPGVKMLLKRKVFSTAEILQEPLDAKTFSDSSKVGRTTNLLNVSLDDSLWESMTAYAARLASTDSVREQGLISPRLMKNVYSAIHHAGDQGLSMVELPENILILGNELAEIAVDTLAEFQLIVKVNAYDHVRVVDSSYKSKYFVVTLEENRQDSVPENSQQISYDISRVLLRNPENNRTSEDVNACDGHGVSHFHSREGPPETCNKGVEEDITTDVCLNKGTSVTKGDLGKTIKFLAPVETRRCQAILPWINGDGSTNDTVYRGLVRRILGTVMQNPGILEEDIINRMIVLNPQSCKQLLDLMILDNHIIIKKMHQTTGCGLPSIFGGLFRPEGKLTEAAMFRKHYFANPMSASLL